MAPVRSALKIMIATALFGVGLVGGAAAVHPDVPVELMVPPRGPALAGADKPSPPIIQEKRLGRLRLAVDTDRSVMGVADRLRLSLQIEGPLDLRATFGEIDTKLGDLVVVSDRTTGPLWIGSQVRGFRRVIMLDAEKPGTATIPAMTVSALSYKEGLQQPVELVSDPITIEVTSVLPADADTAEPKDIAPPVAVTEPGGSRLVPGLAAAISAALAGLGYVWWRRRPASAPVVETGTEPTSAHLEALAALSRLRASNLFAERRLDEFYQRLSDILRRYVVGRYGVMAPNLTTQEVRDILPNSAALSADENTRFMALLLHSDLVKFARHLPSEADMHSDLDNATRFVERTADAGVTVMPAGRAGT